MTFRSTKVEKLFKREAATAPAASKPGLFARIGIKPRQPVLTLEEAFLAILMGAARADGSVSAEEAQEIAALTSRTNTLSGLTPARISEIQRKVEEKFAAEGIEKVLSAACHAITFEKESKPAETRRRAESVLAHAIDIVFADRELREEEQDYIEQLAEHLEVPAERVAVIADVIEIKNAY